MNGHVFEKRFQAKWKDRGVEADWKMLKPGKNGEGLRIAVRNSCEKRHFYVALQELNEVPQGYLAIARQMFKQLYNQNQEEGGNHGATKKKLLCQGK